MPVGPSSPYGGYPTPGPPAPNRTPLFITLGVLVAVALVVMVIALAGGDDDPPETTGNTTPSTEEPEIDEPDPTLPDIEDEPDEPDEDLPDTGVLEVTESGFSTYEDYDGLGGSYGFIVENTGDETLTGIPVAVSLYDNSDAVLETADINVGVIRPGEKLGFGGDLLVDDIPNGISRIDVQVGENSFPPDEPPEGTLTVSGVNTTVDDFSGLVTTFSVASTYEEQIDYPSAYAIFRDSSGAIIGGSSGYGLTFIPAGGETAGEITTFSDIPNVASTEVYVDPGVFY